MSSKNINNLSSDSEEISLKELILEIREWWNYLLSRWLVIVSFGLMGGALGFTYAYFQKPLYTASTTFVLEEDKAGGMSLGNLGGVASMVGIDFGGGGSIFQGDNIMELYKSRKIIEKTLLTKIEYGNRKQSLIDHYIESNKLRDKWNENIELKNIKFDRSQIIGGELVDFTRLQDSLLGTIVNDINKNYLIVAKPDKKLSIIRVDVKSSDEFFAKTLNEQIVKNVNDFYVQTKTKKSADNVALLQQKADSVRAVMNGAIYTAAAVADATPNLNPTRQVQRAAPLQRSQFSAETNKAILGELVKNLEMSKMALLKETPLIQVIDAPVFPLQKVKFGKLKGIAVGSLAGAFLIVVILLVHRMFKRIMA